MKTDRRILIAEDDAFLAKMMSETLAEHGVKCSLAKSGKEAMAALNKNRPDLLLLDLLMPDVDGYEVLQRMKDEGIDVPTIIVSNLSDAKTKERCKSLGAKHYVVKSDIDDQQLWPVVEKYL